MNEAFWASSSYLAVFGLLCGITGFRVGWRIGHRFALPVAQGLFGWAAFALAWTGRGPGSAAAAVGAWALSTTLVSLYVFVNDPSATDRLVVRAATYRAVMLDWLCTGCGPEARPWSTARTHLRELIVYTAAAALTANLGSLILGAILLNFMNAWVATLVRAARRPGRVWLLGWNLWSLIRVAAYLAIGTAATAPLAARLGYPAPAGTIAPLAAGGGFGVIADLLLKLFLAPRCRRLLADAVDLEAAAKSRRPKPPGFGLGLDEGGASSPRGPT